MNLLQGMIYSLEEKNWFLIQKLTFVIFKAVHIGEDWKQIIAHRFARNIDMQYEDCHTMENFPQNSFACNISFWRKQFNLGFSDARWQQTYM